MFANRSNMRSLWEYYWRGGLARGLWHDESDRCHELPLVRNLVPQKLSGSKRTIASKSGLLRWFAVVLAGSQRPHADIGPILAALIELIEWQIARLHQILSLLGFCRQ